MRKKRALRIDRPSGGRAAAVVGYLTRTMMQAKATQDFTRFDTGNAVMAAFLASLETSALPAREATS